MEASCSYRKITKVGTGSYGNCFLCEKEGSSTRVVLKKITYSDDAINEARLLSELSHSNIVVALETYRSERSVYIVLEYLEGGDLDVYIRQNKEKPIKDKLILNYCQQLTEALAYIHSERVVHRDVKPVNILLTADYSVVKLADFGLSARLNEGELLSGRKGTSSYMAPEVLEGRQYDFKCDMWALGCVLYEMVERRRAFEAPSDLAIQHKICSGNYVLPTQSRFRTLIESLLSTSIVERPTAKEFLSKLGFFRRRVPSFLQHAFN